jgi:hypothetical protein
MTTTGIQIPENFLADLYAKERIKECLLRYCRGVDRKEYDLMRAAYHADAYDDHGPYKGDVAGLAAWIERRHEHVEQSMHLLGNCIIELNGAEASVETYGLVFQRFSPEGMETQRMYASGASADRDTSRMMTAIRYVDRFERRDGDWRISNRIVVVETIWNPGEAESIPQDFQWMLTRRDRADVLWESRQQVLGAAGAGERVPTA